MSPSNRHQKPLTAFFGVGAAEHKRHHSSGASGRPISKQRRILPKNGSIFGSCPLCQKSFPFHQLERHASDCNGKQSTYSASVVAKKTTHVVQSEHVTPSDCPTQRKRTACSVASQNPLLNAPRFRDKQPTSEPIPGLYLYEDFITEEEEIQLLSELDGHTAEYASEFLPWKPANFNGPHDGKRWGVHCNLRDRKVGEAENPLPNFIRKILVPKLLNLPPMKGCVPNEANAIDYRRRTGHHLTPHVDDRKLSKEPISNLSLAGDCYMTFRNVAPHRNTAVNVQKVLLKRRCLQVLTGKARYDFSHGIENADLLSDRRVSVTMRESPLTSMNASRAKILEQPAPQLWWKAAMPTVNPVASVTWIRPAREPIPGLFLFPDFITEDEEALILKELDDNSVQSWSSERHTGCNRQKRWGVDHDLWSQALRPPKYELPAFSHSILLPRLQRLECMQGCTPNEVNALDYQRALGHSLGAHVDDRRKHKESIANLSLAGDCYMDFCNVQVHRNLAARGERVLLPRRCLQVMTGKARYDFTHGIATEDLLSDRRVSVTMRETPFQK